MGLRTSEVNGLLHLCDFINFQEISLFIHPLIPFPSSWKRFLEDMIPGFTGHFSPLHRGLIPGASGASVLFYLYHCSVRPPISIPEGLASFKLSSKKVKTYWNKILTTKRCELPKSKLQSREQERQRCILSLWTTATNIKSENLVRSSYTLGVSLSQALTFQAATRRAMMQSVRPIAVAQQATLAGSSCPGRSFPGSHKQLPTQLEIQPNKFEGRLGPCVLQGRAPQQ